MWWETVVQSEEKAQGRDQINFTINILWQLWKAINENLCAQSDRSKRHSANGTTGMDGVQNG